MSETEKDESSNIRLWLFGKPAWELDLESVDADGNMVEAIDGLAHEMCERLHETSDILKKLLENGWTGSGGLYDIMLYKDVTVNEAQAELVKPGINPSEVNLERWPWDEEEEIEG